MIEILGYIFRRKARLVLTVTGIAIGVFALVTVGSMAETLGQSLAEVEQQALNISIVVRRGGDPSPAVARRIDRMPGVAGHVFRWQGGLEITESVVRISVNPEGCVALDSNLESYRCGDPTLKLAQGRKPALGSLTEVALDHDLAERRGLTVGSTIVIRKREFRVVGIYEKPLTGSAGRYAYVTMEAAQRFWWPDEPDYRGQLSIIPQPGVDPEDLARRIEEAEPEVAALSPRQQLESTRQGLVLITAIFSASGVLASLVAGLVVVNTMVMAVHERRREIGVKKAIGASDGDIVGEYALEAGVIGALGGLAGLFLGWMTVIALNNLARAAFDASLFTLTPRLAVAAVAGPALLSLVAGLYPAWQAARTDPLRALRGDTDGGANLGGELLGPLLRRKTRTTLTLLGIAVGVLALVVIGALSEYLNQGLDWAVAHTAGNIGVYPRTGEPYGADVVRRLRRVPGVRGLSFTGPSTSIDEDDLQHQDERVIGVASDLGGMETGLPIRLELQEGRWLTPDSLDEVVVGYLLAERRGLRLGDPLMIREHPFTVVGICRRNPFAVLTVSLDRMGFITLEAQRAILREPGLQGSIQVFTDPAEEEAVAARIREQFPGLRLNPSQEIVAQIRQALNVFALILSSSGVLAVLVGGLAVINTMLMAVGERTREIGVKKAIGAGDVDIIGEVVLEAGLLGGLGGLTGLFLGWMLTVAANTLLLAAEGTDLFLVTPRLAVGAIVFAVFLGMIAGVYPAWRASRLDPVQSLRSE